jgi:toxin ParE1/3/4
VARYRLSEPAKADIASILRTSETAHGAEARARYRGLLTAALRRIASDPTSRSTVDCAALFPELRSFHIRHSRTESREAPVGRPIHVTPSPAMPRCRPGSIRSCSTRTISTRPGSTAR